MRIRSIGTLVLAALVVSACGGDDGKQGEVADMFVELAESEGIELDQECVEEAAGQLSDSDAEKIVDAGTEGSADVSDEAQVIGEQILGCLDVGSYRDSILSQFETDPSMDTDCLRAELEDLATVDEIDERVIDAAFECSS